MEFSVSLESWRCMASLQKKSSEKNCKKGKKSSKKYKESNSDKTSTEGVLPWLDFKFVRGEGSRN